MVNGKMEEDMEKVSSLILIAMFTVDGGRLVENMDKVLMYLLIQT
jgi:hypothetical protein